MCLECFCRGPSFWETTTAIFFNQIKRWVVPPPSNSGKLKVYKDPVPCGDWHPGQGGQPKRRGTRCCRSRSLASWRLSSEVQAIQSSLTAGHRPLRVQRVQRELQVGLIDGSWRPQGRGEPSHDSWSTYHTPSNVRIPPRNSRGPLWSRLMKTVGFP